MEEEKEEKKPKTKKVEKTTWDWELINDTKPIWMRKQSEIEDSDYTEFYKSISKDFEEPMSKVHFTAEGEVTFKSILFVPKKLPFDMFQNYGKKTDNIKVGGFGVLALHFKVQLFDGFVNLSAIRETSVYHR